MPRAFSKGVCRSACVSRLWLWRLITLAIPTNSADIRESLMGSAQSRTYRKPGGAEGQRTPRIRSRDWGVEGCQP
jgi:hypothetical protein